MSEADKNRIRELEREISALRVATAPKAVEATAEKKKPTTPKKKKKSPK